MSHGNRAGTRKTGMLVRNILKIKKGQSFSVERATRPVSDRVDGFTGSGAKK
jgi:hypothetical protein